jgi:hypothetical protein
MTASRREYWTDLLEDCEAILKDFEGYDHDGRGQVVAALVLADAINGLRKTILMTRGETNESRT